MTHPPHRQIATALRWRWHRLKDAMGRFCGRWVEPVWPRRYPLRRIGQMRRYLADRRRYGELSGESIPPADCVPCLGDDTGVSRFGGHYDYQNVWAFRRICRSAPDEHVDVGSQLPFVTMLTAVTRVTFVDIRPLRAQLDDLVSVAGSILDLPFRDSSVRSLSCLHVIEHIGLGRYGDELNPRGSERGVAELLRVLASGGDLYLSLPLGRPRVCFNAHRVHAPDQVLAWFAALELLCFAGVDDDGRFLRDIQPSRFEGAEYACGFFHFRKPDGRTPV